MFHLKEIIENKQIDEFGSMISMARSFSVML